MPAPTSQPTPGSDQTPAPNDWTDARARAAWAGLVRCRRFEDAVMDAWRAGDIPGVVHVATGQEATAVGAALALAPDDQVTSTHRGHGHALALGTDPTALMAELMGRRTGLVAGRGGSKHLSDPAHGLLATNAIVGASVPLAAGAALSAKTRQTGGVALAFTGDGATNQGAVFEAMVMAVALALPLIILVENNGYGQTTASAYASGGQSLTARARGFGLDARTVDGSRVDLVWSAVSRAADRARLGLGPSFIEAAVGRLEGFFSLDAQAYRGADEVARLRDAACPLARFRAKARGGLDDATLAAIETDQAEAVDAALAAARAAPPAGP
ncbi:hypothetical protein CCR85_14505 [Rhodothalassium salexigens]|uniref:thiamine pyrophosphate-dependent dehydrogenase E1 component subunit alpha n=1 Tax=Rhodothalassium salexigens TaxID=1086 RepID=UPI001911D3FB|nr:thiamine pyrophosphate-dependent dehydrogenase E1 component subunit alpha [Rhodothalassium salexigens]MBK5912691.1 hypothetical protein [Rhodothalassium salexigens]MBK5921676.1 hypothetical protein [Rhodothalassium salexigens]